MNPHLDDLRELYADLGHDAEARLAAAWSEAAQAMGTQALRDWLDGARALHALGRGAEPVTAFIDAAPALAHELGEEAPAALARAALAMACRTSGGVIALLISSAPLAARRLGEGALFRAWLDFLDTLLAQAPRALRPLLERTDGLLAQLTLGGLRRWAWRGVQSHRHDDAAQDAWFSLGSAHSRGVLQQERKGTLFAHAQRRIGMYLRALWGRGFLLRPTADDFEQREGTRPFIAAGVIHVPDAYDDLPSPAGAIDGVTRYRAAGAHAAAHLMYARPGLAAHGLDALQRACVELVEDARVEHLAMLRFPGLLELWRAQYAARAALRDDWSLRLACALLDVQHADPHPLPMKLRRLFLARRARWEAGGVSWEIGLVLARELRALGVGELGPGAAYRDDNRYVWDVPAEAPDERVAAPRQLRRRVGMMEFINTLDVETAGDDAQEVWTLDGTLFDDDGTTFNAREAGVSAPRAFHYGEWDYRMRLERPGWCTVLERPAAHGDARDIQTLIEEYRPLVARLRRIIEAMQPQGLQRLRAQEDGDDLDLDAAVRAATQLRGGTLPDPRLHVRHVRRQRDIAALLLIDLSQSANDVAGAGGHTLLRLAQQASALLAGALAKLGDPFALHGFCSDGREDVSYYRLKDFDEPFAAPAQARLAGVRARLSTRMGAALRHAGRHLARRPERRKLLLVLTDGAPADVDVRDPRHLHEDARKAARDLAAKGVTTFCFSLDAQADRYVADIFGPRHYFILDHIETLPARLPALYLGLTR